MHKKALNKFVHISDIEMYLISVIIKAWKGGKQGSESREAEGKTPCRSGKGGADGG